jgi:hypothetical protein
VERREGAAGDGLDGNFGKHALWLGKGGRWLHIIDRHKAHALPLRPSREEPEITEPHIWALPARALTSTGMRSQIITFTSPPDAPALLAATIFGRRLLLFGAGRDVYVFHTATPARVNLSLCAHPSSRTAPISVTRPRYRTHCPPRMSLPSCLVS